MIKAIPAFIGEVVRRQPSQHRNIRALLKFVLILTCLIAFYTTVFHFLMVWEGQDHTLFSGVYWTLTVMTTLGFGDIVFQSDIGRVFSAVVLMSGLVFMLVLLPFTFIEFFYAPWMAAQSAARAPKKLSDSTSDHVILTHYDATSAMLVRKLAQYHYSYVILENNLERALKLHDEGYKVIVGSTNDPETWRNAHVDKAALVAATDLDIPNTNAVFTARQECRKVPITAIAKLGPSMEILQMAGSNQVLRLDEMLGQHLARCTDGAPTRAHVVGEFGPLLIAEANVKGTNLIGRSLRECNLRQETGVLVVGMWERGSFKPAKPDARIETNMILLLAGSRKQIEAFNETFVSEKISTTPVMIVGGGRVGRATAKALSDLGIEYRIIEQTVGRVADEHCIVGDASDHHILRKAGILRAKTVLITTRDDDMNIYLTIFCRRLRPDIQIISRATLERNVATLHRAGADFVMSYASLGANAIFNFLTHGDILMIAEGLNVFKVRLPSALKGKTIQESEIREKTGCLLVAIRKGEDTEIVPPAERVLESDHEIILVGSAKAEDNFLEAFS